MKRYFIEEAKCGYSKGIMRPPIPYAVVAGLRFREDGGEPKWFFLNEFNGMPMFFISDEDFFDLILNEDGSAIGRMGPLVLPEYEGIKFGRMKYDPESLAENAGNPAAALVRYLIALVKAERKDVAGLVEAAKGKYADELDIPEVAL